MSRQLHARAGEIFLAACALPADEREAYVQQACGAEAQLRVEVESLLGHHRDEDPPQGPSAPREPPGPFRPGELFAARYRILTLLGRGGMGEVYRAHDELLDQPVAVKVLLGGNDLAVDALLREVRLARTVTHPAVCRVYDVSASAGVPFFTMELVEGEDLASLLRRAGRLAPERVKGLTRQLLAGLAAAHAKGVIHRDLKPANILIDGSGRPHITDFGIALTREGPAGVTAGTPAYMAPEQWAGERADERTDLYSLALVLHEALTGRPVFAADRRRDLARMQSTARPTAPSVEVPGVDPAFEAVLLRALEKDRALRPASALAMAAALPGGDALQMALEVGVTPPVEVVMAAGSPVGMSRRRALACLLLLGLGLAAILPLADVVHPIQAAGEIEDPAVLEDRAETILEELGYRDPAAASEFGFVSEPGSMASRGRPLFWFVQPLERWVPRLSATVLEEPTNGQVLALLDPTGRLLFLRVDPWEPLVDGATRSKADPFTTLFAAAQLNPDAFEAVTPDYPLPVYADRRGTWLAREGSPPMRVDAAAVDGRAVFFSVSAATDTPVSELPDEDEPAELVILLVVGLVLLPALPLAWRNARQGRSDRPGARRLVIAIGALLALAWLLTAGDRLHPLHTPESVFFDRSMQVLFHAVWVWVAYLAFEPPARRWWPETLVAWNRLLRGAWRAADVGASLLVGAVVGVALTAFGGLTILIDPPAVATSNAATLNAAMGLHRTLGVALGLVPLAIYNGFVIVLQLVLLQFLIRRRRRVIPLAWAVLAVSVALLAGGGGGAWLYGAGFSLVAVGLLVRFGLLTFSVAFWVQSLLSSFPLTADPDAWFAGSGWLAAGLVFSLGAAGARIGSSRPPPAP